MSNAAKNVDISQQFSNQLKRSIYVGRPKLFSNLYLATFVDTLAKPFFPCNTYIYFINY